MDIGKQVKYYRTQKKVKQEELAEYLGVSFQAVSKWETGNSVPDISLLPQLAVYFGVTIDELFKMPNEAQFERIENTVDVEEKIDSHTFQYYENFLLEMTKRESDQERAWTDLALIHNHQAVYAHKEASRYAKLAFEKNPENHQAWAWYLEAENGACGDEWYDNHFEVIKYLKGFLEKNPGNFLALYGLIENLLDDKEYEEAEKYVEQLAAACPKNRKYMIDMYRGDVAMGKGNMDEAMSRWEKATKEEPQVWQAYCSMGDRLKIMGRYEEAISYYEKCYEMQEAPRFSDGLYSIAQVAEHLGDYTKAIDANQQIIQNLNEDYGVTRSVQITQRKAEIARLKKSL